MSSRGPILLWLDREHPRHIGITISVAQMANGMESWVRLGVDRRGRTLRPGSGGPSLTVTAGGGEQKRTEPSHTGQEGSAWRAWRWERRLESPSRYSGECWNQSHVRRPVHDRHQHRCDGEGADGCLYRHVVSADSANSNTAAGSLWCSIPGS